MAWNGSAEKGAANAPKERAAKAPPSKWRGLVALVVVVAAGGLAAWWFMRPSGRDALVASDMAKPSQIAEVKPAVVTNAVVEEVAPAPEPEKPDPNARPTRPGQKLNGYVMLASGRLHKVKGERVYDPSETSKPKYAIFKHPSENIIAGLLSVKPGNMLVGTPRYNGKIIEDFSKSLFDPIEISPDDSDEDKELKRLVQEAKENLRAEMNAGKDIEQILMDERAECQRLAQYKQTLKRSVYEEMRKDDVTEADIEDYVQAANKLLEQKGIAPLELGPISRVKLKKKEIKK